MANKINTKAIWTGAGAGVIVPGLTFFINLIPPLFPYISFIVSAIAGAIVLIVHHYKKEITKSSQVKQSIRFIAIALVLIIAYITTFQLLTINSLQDERYQIGFRKADWSLTEAAVAYKADNPQSELNDYMLDFAAYQENGTERIWTVFSIYLASLTLIVLFFGSFVLWSIGFAFLIKAKKANNRLLEASDDQ